MITAIVLCIITGRKECHDLKYLDTESIVNDLIRISGYWIKQFIADQI